MKFAGVFQEIDDFFDFFFGFVATGNVGKGHGIGVLVEQARLAFPKTECAALAAALHLAHEINPHADQEQHGAPADQQGHEQRAFLAGFDIKLHPVGNQIAHQAPVQIGCRSFDAALVGRDGQNFGTALPLLDHGALDVFVADFFQKIGVAHGGGADAAVGVKLLEYGKKYQANDQPDCNF